MVAEERSLYVTLQKGYKSSEGNKWVGMKSLGRRFRRGGERLWKYYCSINSGKRLPGDNELNNNKERKIPLLSGSGGIMNNVDEVYRPLNFWNQFNM